MFLGEYLMDRIKVIFSITLISLSCLLILTGCYKDKTQDPALYSPALIVVPNAQKVRYQKKTQTDQVYYQLQEQYPATKTISYIYSILDKAGWQPLFEDLLNPGFFSSHVRGWSAYLDGRKQPEQEVHQWMADWKDKQNNVVRYTFQYTKPAVKHKQNEEIFSPPSLFKQLKVNAIYIPTSIEKLMQDNTKSILNKSETVMAFEQATTEALIPINQLSMNIFTFCRERGKYPAFVEELRVFDISHKLPIDLSQFDKLSFTAEMNDTLLTVNYTLKEYQKKIVWSNGKSEIIRIKPMQGKLIFDIYLGRF